MPPLTGVGRAETKEACMTSQQDRGRWMSVPGRDRNPVGLHHGLMLQMNEHLVLDHIHERQTTTRPQIARHLGLSPATVSRIVRRLVEQDLVRERRGTSQGGRPPTLISFNPLSGAVIGIDLGGYSCHGVLADLAGEILYEDIRPTNDAGDPFATLSQMLERLSEHARVSDLPVETAAIGVPAVIDAGSGLALAGPAVSWDRFPIAAALAERIEIPFVVENEANLKAFGHAWRGDAVGLTDFVVLSMGSGIGAAIVVDGELVRGRHGSAGEIGYLILDRSQLRSPSRDGRGSFEQMAGGPAIAALAEQRLATARGPSSLIEAGDPVTPESVFRAAAEHDPIAMGVVRDIAEQVAMAIVALTVAVDPELVVLDGAVGRALQLVAPEIQELVDRGPLAPPQIIASSLGDQATVLGAVAAALDLTRSRRAPRAIVRRGPSPYR